MSKVALKHSHTNDVDHAHPDLERVNILLVDDLPEKLLVYESVLEELGQNLITARSGEEALKLVLQHEFAVILLDVNMPGVDGFETASLIRKRRKSARTPIIFLTAFTDEVLMAQGYASGAVDYLPTPVVPEVLRAKVRVFIELFQMRRQAALQAEEKGKRTAAEQSARKAAFLARLSEVLARAQNKTEIMRALAMTPIPYLADVSMVWLADETQIKWAHLEPVTGACLVNEESLAGLPWLEKIIANVSKTNQPQFFSDIPSSGLPEHFVSSLASGMALPIGIHGQLHGVLVLARTQSEVLYQLNEISLANDLASRAGVALEKALLIDRIKEADRRKDEFLGMLAHELRNPLGPVRNAVHLLQLMGPREERQDQLRDIIDRQVTHMARLIDDLLDATRLARGQILLRKERCDLTKIVQQTADDYRAIFEASGLQMELDLPKGSVWVMGDPTRLVQTVGNLLHNAHKFTDPSGTVSIQLAQEDERHARITIRDTGIGIEAAMLPYIFDTFRQAEQGLDRNRGGLGLGLALVKGLVQLHDGTVSAASNAQEKGTQMTIVLPLHNGEATAPETLDELPPPVEGEKRRILVIEDNRDAAESARMLLSLEGYDIEVAHTGAAGLEMAAQFRPHIILCDIGLPGMDGYQVARQIRQDKKLKSTYIVALTGYGRDEDQRQAREAGFDMHLTKPIDHNSLRRALASRPAKSA